MQQKFRTSITISKNHKIAHQLTFQTYVVNNQNSRTCFLADCNTKVRTNISKLEALSLNLFDHLWANLGRTSNKRDDSTIIEWMVWNRKVKEKNVEAIRVTNSRSVSLWSIFNILMWKFNHFRASKWETSHIWHVQIFPQINFQMEFSILDHCA